MDGYYRFGGSGGIETVPDPLSAFHEEATFYDHFLDEHPKPTLEELVNFIEQQEGIRVSENQPPYDKTHPSSRVLTDNPIEAHLIRKAIDERFYKVGREGRDRSAKISAETRSIERYVDTQKKKVLLYLAEKIGLKRSAALLEAEEHLGETFRGSDTKWPERIALWESSKENLRRDIGKRTETITDSEAREILARTFNVDFETYNEFFFPRTHEDR